MFAEHPDIKLSLSDEASIWRYTTLGKLIALLEGSELYFARLDTLDDPFEGAFTNVEPDFKADAPFTLEQYKILRRGVYVSGRSMLYVNCWHANEYESAAMWQLYSLSGEGLAIRSTVGRLKESFDREEGKNEQVYVGSVAYLDYEREFIPMNTIFTPALRKRKSFEHEREIRCLAMRIAGGELLVAKQPEGIAAKVDVKTLMDRLYVAPGAPEWYARAVAAVCKRFDLAIDPVQGMAERPIY
jgi:hypothetical protein